MPASNSFLEKAIANLKRKHRCHTVILYGSRARGDFSATSDYDLMGVKKSGKRFRLAEQKPGGYLDVFIFPESDLQIIGEEHLYMKDAQVLFQSGTFGTQFVKKLASALKRKHKPLPVDEIAARKVWLHKMYERCTRGDIEANYRRSWLHEALLYDYFNIRKSRYWGSKESFTWLKKHDRLTYELFEKVLAQQDDFKNLKKLVERVSQEKFERVSKIEKNH